MNIWQEVSAYLSVHGDVPTIFGVALEIVRVVVARRGSSLTSRRTLALLQFVGEARQVEPLADELAVVDEILLGLLKISLECLDLALSCGEILGFVDFILFNLLIGI